MRGGDILIRTAQNAPSNQTESAETDMNGKTPSGKVEMPVAMALLLAQNPRAISSFASMKPERQDVYLSRARRAGSSAEMRAVVEDIVKIG